MANLMLIALGGAIGAVLRAGITMATIRAGYDHFPFGTLAINVVGSLIIGLLWALNEKESFSVHTASFLFVGLLGAFTTFSAYSLDSIRLLQDGRILAGMVYIVGNNIGAIGGAALGYLAGKMMGGG